MAASNFAFILLSLNARGIRSFEKRKVVFGWVMRQQVDICLIQETYSTKEVEKFVKRSGRVRCISRMVPYIAEVCLS